MALASTKIYSSEKLAAYHVDMYIFKKNFGQQKHVKGDCLTGVSMQKILTPVMELACNQIFFFSYLSMK